MASKHDVARYRATANALRANAEVTNLPRIKEQNLEAAARYDELADRAERAANGRD